MNKVKKSVWLPTMLLIYGVGVYVYFGITMNAWVHNLYLLLGFLAIIGALVWALRKKEKHQERK